VDINTGETTSGDSRMSAIFVGCHIGEEDYGAANTTYAVNLHARHNEIIFSGCHLGYVKTGSVNIGTVPNTGPNSIMQFTGCTMFVSSSGTRPSQSITTQQEDRLYIQGVLKTKAVYDGTNAIVTFSNGVAVDTNVTIPAKSGMFQNGGDLYINAVTGQLVRLAVAGTSKVSLSATVLTIASGVQLALNSQLTFGTAIADSAASNNSIFRDSADNIIKIKDSAGVVQTLY
jgi:hypothetical protein